MKYSWAGILILDVLFIIEILIGTSAYGALKIKQEQIGQLNGRWVARHLVVYTGDTALSLSPSDITVDYQAWVSNSRLRAHAVPRRSEVKFTLVERKQGFTSVLESNDEKARCQERVTVILENSLEPVSAFSGEQYRLKLFDYPISVASGGTFWLTLLIDHVHFRGGTYDPLLGQRELTIQLAEEKLVLSMNMNSPLSSPVLPTKLNKPTQERLDPAQVRSGKPTLYLAADLPGYQYFRFDDLAARFGTRYRLSFFYLIAVGTEGESHVRIQEYEDTPKAWRNIEGGGFDERLSQQGHWQRFERLFTTKGESTTLALDFRIVGANIGEMWIDDVKLEALTDEMDKSD